MFFDSQLFDNVYPVNFECIFVKLVSAKKKIGLVQKKRFLQADKKV